MSNSFKKSGIVLFCAALMLGSCSSPNLEIVDHGLHGAEHSIHLSSEETLIHSVTENEGELTENGTAPTEDTDETEMTSEEYTAPVTLSETTTAAEALPVTGMTSAATPAETAADTTAVPDETKIEEAVETSTNSYMLKLSSKPNTYSFETQDTNGNMMVLGPNLVYVGETFDFECKFPDADENTKIKWSLTGSCGKIDKSGVFTAVTKGVCTVTATDKTTGVYASMLVHCIKTADDVDFIPLVNNIPIANKTYPLPKDYDPGLSSEARAAFVKLQAAAKAEGLNIFPISAYRSYAYQQQVYAGWVNLYGSEADLISARPGFSEHQLGLAIDVNSAEYAFADTREGKWLAEHCAEYGFILRYPSFEARSYTGYSYEPWHIRYVGKSIAKKVMDSGKTLEELLHIDSYYR